MNTISWQAYPLVGQTELARTWLETQSWLQLAPKTIDAYGRSLNDFLGFCMKHAIQPEQVTREQIAPCSRESEFYGCSVIIWLKNTSGLTIRSVGVTMSHIYVENVNLDHLPLSRTSHGFSRSL
jgi:hypothetical protein